jgi:Tat protein translocase TatB subunit
MGNIGSSELLLLFVLALLLLGPRRLPEIGEMVGKTLRRFRQASRELRDELDVKRDLDLRRELDLDVARDLDLKRDIDALDAPRITAARDARPRGAGLDPDAEPAGAPPSGASSAPATSAASAPTASTPVPPPTPETNAAAKPEAGSKS